MLDYLFGSNRLWVFTSSETFNGKESSKLTNRVMHNQWGNSRTVSSQEDGRDAAWLIRIDLLNQ